MRANIMFTGIIKKISKIKKAELKNGSLFLLIEKPRNWKIKKGDSLSVNGICLTVIKADKFNFIVELMPETLKRTAFNKAISQEVNLEQSARISDFLGGHLVSGHIDTTGRIEKITKQGRSKIYKISFPKIFQNLMIEKGSISADGVSLTVVKAGNTWFTVSLVEYTIKNTTLGKKQAKDLVNLEFDIIAKYLDKICRKTQKK